METSFNPSKSKNKVDWEEEFDEGFTYQPTDVPFRRVNPVRVDILKSFIRQTLISTINKIGLEKKEIPPEKEALDALRNDVFGSEVFKKFGYNQAVSDLQKVKQDLIKQLTK